MRRSLILAAIVCAAPLAAVRGEDRPAPLPTLPPEPRTLHLAPGALARDRDDHPLDRAGLARDIEALTRTVQHVEASLNDASSATHGESGATAERPAITKDTPTTPSERFGPALVARGSGPDALVTADIAGEPVDVLLREVAKLVAVPLEDDRVPGLRRTVALRVKEVPASEVFDRLLGQVGVAWRLEGHAAAQRMVLTNAPSDEDIDAAAERALMRAQTNAAANNDVAAEAEARYLLAKRALDRQQPVEAMRRFNELVQAMSRTRDKDALKWVQRGIRGIGDSMSALRQWGDARSVYRNYIGRAAQDDPDLPAVYLASAEAGRQRGIETADPLAFDEAAEDLHAMLEKYGEDKRRPEVPAARLMIGGLLYDAHRWGEAETQLKRWVNEAGGHPTDVIAGQLADCAFELGRFEEARAGFEDLFRHYREEQATAPKAVYERAAYRIGLCHLREPQPRFVHALFAFQRAQAAFPKTQLTAELLLNIARCYAEIEREDEAVAALWDMLHQDAGTQPVGSDAQAHLDAELGALLGRLSEYPGPVRAKAMFYIAQAEHRRAERDRASRAVVAAQAVGYYERVLGENPSAELQDAARIGLARACFLAGNDERGELELTNALKDPGLGARDRAYAARLLGDHLRSQGHAREAIKAYQGVVE